MAWCTLARQAPATRIAAPHRRYLLFGSPGRSVPGRGYAIHRGQAVWIRGMAHGVEQIHSSGADIPSKAVDLLASAKEHAAGNKQQLSASEVEKAVIVLRSLPAGDTQISTVRELVASSLEAVLPELLRRGSCLSTVLQLPLTERYMEKPLKALILLLARRLRRQRGLSLPAAELPRIPALLQRLGIQDNDLFDDFCSTCATSLPELRQQELIMLFRSVEDYGLLHSTKGTALARLAAAFLDHLEATAERNTSCGVDELSALCHAVLSVRSRAVSLPILERLRTSLRVEAAGPEESTKLLAATAELHRAIGVPSDMLVAALERCGREVRLLPGDNEKAVQLMPSMLRACGLCWWSEHQASSALFEALLLRLTAVGPAALPAQVLTSCRHLPAAFRRQLVESLLLTTEAQQLMPQLGLQEAAGWLSVLHDLPALEMARAQQANADALASIVEVLLERLLQSRAAPATPEIAPTNAQPSLPASAWVTAYLAATNTSQSLTSVSAVPQPLDSLAKQVLECFEPFWPQLTARDAEELFRVHGDISPGIARAALQQLGRVSNVCTQLVLLSAASRAPGTSEADLASGYEVVQRCIRQLSAPAELGAAEASLRRRQPPAGARELHAKLLAEVRAQLFHVTVEADVVWKRTPARGYIRYLERCIAKGRQQAASTVVDMEAVETAGGVSPAEDAQMVPSAPAVDAVVQLEEEEEEEEAFILDEWGEPRSRVTGVNWHRGMASWEVRVEARGHRVLGGYFKPQDNSTAELERALLAAIERRRSLLEDPPKRWYAPR